MWFATLWLLKLSMLYEKDAERKTAHHQKEVIDSTSASGFASYETIGQPASTKEEK